MEPLEVADQIIRRAHREALRHVDELDQDVLVQELRQPEVEDHELAVVGVVTEQQRSEMRPRAFRI